MILLKRHFYLKITESGPLLINEHTQVLEKSEYAEILKRLVVGIDPSSITDFEFLQIEYLNERGYLGISDHPDAAAWELSGAFISTVVEQSKHLDFSISDFTYNQVGFEVGQILKTCGFLESKTPKLKIVFADSYFSLPEIEETPFLPIICNKMKIFTGPIQFNWSENLALKVVKNKSYVPQARYVLPKLFDNFQRSWIATNLGRMIVLSNLDYIGCMQEFNMTSMVSKLIPLQ